AMETRPVVCAAPSSASRRLASLPARLVRRTAPSSITATPAESYPRYSRRARPWRATSTGREAAAAALGPAYPTIPHLPLTLMSSAAREGPRADLPRVLPHDRGARRAAVPVAPQQRAGTPTARSPRPTPSRGRELRHSPG